MSDHTGNTSSPCQWCGDYHGPQLACDPDGMRREIERLRLALNKSQTECGHMEADLQSARDDREACLTFLRTEMHWEEFREEFFANTASGENARKLMAFLNRFKPKAGGNP